MKILVVVPTYNERENIGPLLRELLAQSDALDVWVADDGSPDGTGDVVREAMATWPGRVELRNRADKGGREEAHQESGCRCRAPDVTGSGQAHGLRSPCRCGRRGIEPASATTRIVPLRGGTHKRVFAPPHGEPVAIPSSSSR